MIISSGGQATFKGINAQAAAAFSLFLQYLKDKNFHYIHLEAPTFKDFNLIFKSGKKIICESKYRKNSFTYKNLKEVLEDIISENKINSEDEILIICEKVSERLLNDIKYLKYQPDNLDTNLKRKMPHISPSLLTKVKFWQVSEVGVFYKIINSLLLELIGFWMKETDLVKFMNEILVRKFYIGSEKSDRYEREQIISEIKLLADDIKKDSVYYDDVSEQDLFNKYKEIESALNKSPSSHFTKPKELSALSLNIDLMKFIINKLKEREEEISLLDWKELWEIKNVPFFLFGLIELFRKNCKTYDNQKYIIFILNDIIKNLRPYYYNYFPTYELIKLINKIIKKTPQSILLQEAFKFVREGINYEKDNYFYIKEGNNQKESEFNEFCNLLYNLYTAGDNELKSDIIEYIFLRFNFRNDYEKYVFPYPQELYFMIVDWIKNNFLKNFNSFVKMLIQQFKFEHKKYASKEFNGWELATPIFSISGNNYHVNDWKFVALVLEPVLIDFYEKNKERCWIFIKKNCVTRENLISSNKPDFLNRSIYKLIINYYMFDNLKESQEAFCILSDFILSKKGLPSKCELIFQEINKKIVCYEKLWCLLNLVCSDHKIPANFFVEKIIASLVKNGDEAAKSQLEKWFLEDSYYNLSWSNCLNNISLLIDLDIDLAIRLFCLMINNNSVNIEGSHFSPYTASEVLVKIIYKNYNKGIAVLKSLELKENLSQYQQLLYVHCIVQIAKKEHSEDTSLLTNLYDDILFPLLKKHNKNLANKFTCSHARELIVQFASELANKKHIKESLTIISYFIADSNPDTQDKHIMNGQRLRTFYTVRGWCADVLSQCICLEGRKYLSQVIRLIKKLAGDDNYRVIGMSCHAIATLCHYRFSMLSNSNVLFFHDNNAKALVMAEKVENIAINLFDKFLSWNSNVKYALMESIKHVIWHLHALNQEDTLLFTQKIFLQPNDIICEFADVLIFIAETRKNYYQEWKISAPTLYKLIEPVPYNEGNFREELINKIKKILIESPLDSSKFVLAVINVNNNKIDDDFEKSNNDTKLKYFEVFSHTYQKNNFDLIYSEILRQFENGKINLWFDLLINCLKAEKAFYEEKFKENSLAEFYWYPSLYCRTLLEIIYDSENNEMFIKAAKIFFAFPKGLNLHESERLVNILELLLLEDGEFVSDARQILNSLFEREPAKYFNMKSRLLEYLK